MKRFTSIILIILALVLIVSGCAKENTPTDEKTYQYYTAEETKKFIEDGKDWIILDIQVEDEWNAHHIKGAIPTYAYPVKEDADRAKLEAVLPQLEGDKEILVVCPGGGGGATRTIDYLVSKGIDEKRFFILENGQSKWPYDELLESKEEVKTLEETVEFVDTSYVVSADWLKENMEKENVLILDARGADTHKKGHIPGAIAVMWQGFSNMEGAPGKDPNWGTVLEPKALSERLSENGITKEKEIIVYTTSPDGWGEEGRIVWMLRRAGFDNAKILDGGFDLWKSKGYEVTKDDVVPTPEAVEIQGLDNKTNIDTEELASKLDKVVIIDVREKDEYEGATKYGEPRGGHLPGAINIPFNQFLNKDGTLKTAKEIKTILDDNGINKDDEIVTYCTAGIRSAHMQIVLTMMGYDNVKNYDASFYGWSGNNDLEVVK